MKFNLKQFLPEEISDEAAFQLVLFLKDLALALEANYFDHMLRHNNRRLTDSFMDCPKEDVNPF